MKLFKKIDVLRIVAVVLIFILFGYLYYESLYEWILIPGFPLGIIFGQIACLVYPKEYCIGMGFDGGPLEWVEFVGAIVGAASVYTVIIIVFIKTYVALKNKN